MSLVKIVVLSGTLAACDALVASPSAAGRSVRCSTVASCRVRSSIRLSADDADDAADDGEPARMNAGARTSPRMNASGAEQLRRERLQQPRVKAPPHWRELRHELTSLIVTIVLALSPLWGGFIGSQFVS
eukprot:2804369-Prymnesium_polylepis.1